MKKQDFFDSSKNLKSEEELDDLRGQAHSLSAGICKKFKTLKTVGIILIIQFILLLSNFILILIKNVSL
jgi:hypothetical protein